MVNPFNDKWNIEISSQQGVFLETDLDPNKDLDINLSILKNGFIEFKVNTEIIAKFVDDITNRVYLYLDNNEINSSEATTLSGAPLLAITKSVITESEVTLPSRNKEIKTIGNGEKLIYVMRVENNSNITAHNVKVVSDLYKISIEAGINFLDLDKIKTVGVVNSMGENVSYIDNMGATSGEIIVEKISPNSYVIVKVEAFISDTTPLRVGEFIVSSATAQYNQKNEGNNDRAVFSIGLGPIVQSNEVILTPVAPALELTKNITVQNVDKMIYPGDTIEYTLSIKNNTNLNIYKTPEGNSVTITDTINKITSSYGTRVFTDIKIQSVLANGNPLDYTGNISDTDDTITLSYIPKQSEAIVTISAKVSENAIFKAEEEITNIFTTSYDNLEAEVSVKANMENAIIINKTTPIKETSVGKFVPYTISVTNNQKNNTNNIFLKDILPAGFKYQEDSAILVDSSENKEKIKVEGVRTLNIGPFSVKSGETVEITYLAKVSVGVVNGKYINRAVAINSSGNTISNESTAKVYVVEDKLFQTSTILGKVFNDIDGDGYQDPAEASKIKIYHSNEKQPISIKKVLPGRKSSKEDLSENTEIVYLKLESLEKLQDVRVTTAEGTDITITKDGKVIQNHTGLVKNGMSGQNIVVNRKVMKTKDKKPVYKNVTNKGKEAVVVYYDIPEQIVYVEVITIINTGVQEVGIPGVRLATVEGLIIETDQYGRYHIPEVSSSKGKNFIIKVDSTTLPQGFEFTTENPKVIKLGNVPIKANFGVKNKNTKLSNNKEEK